ncbi:MAG: L-2,4-diaminobutyric acid acetyltransferase [Parvibaculaceae bacterium]
MTGNVDFSGDVVFRPPKSNEGLQVHDLIHAGGGLDANSLYCNVLMAHHFAATSAVAVSRDDIVGFVTAYRPPDRDDTLFVWQVGVDGAWRGKAIARRLLLSILDRGSCQSVQYLTATITPTNEASWALFESAAQALNTSLSKAPLFDSEMHFGGRHESETEIKIGPISRPTICKA